MSKKCIVCGKFVSTEAIKCIKCDSGCHRQCAVCIKPHSKAPASWLCKGCKSNQISPNTSSTASSKSEENSPLAQSSEDKSVLIQDIKLVHTELIKVAQEMALFRQELSQLTTTLTTLNKRFDNVEERLSTLEKNTEVRMNLLETKTSELRNDFGGICTYVNTELNDYEQLSFRNDLVISGISESDNEDFINVATTLSQNLGIAVDDRDIVFAERKGPRVVHSKTGQPSRPRPVVIRLVRRVLRDDLLRSARSHRTSGAISNTSTTEFYVNERLTRHNRNLFYEARQEGKRKGWRFVWTRNGYIFARQTAVSAKHRIQNVEDIRNVFGNPPQ